MSLKRHFELMADYNRWMNGKLYQVAAELPVAVLNENRGAYFGSILGTFNHIMVGYIMCQFCTSTRANRNGAFVCSCYCLCL